MNIFPWALLFSLPFAKSLSCRPDHYHLCYYKTSRPFCPKVFLFVHLTPHSFLLVKLQSRMEVSQIYSFTFWGKIMSNSKNKSPFLLWICSSHNLCPPGNCECDFIWKYSLWRYNQVKMKSYWVEVCHKSNMTRVLIHRGKFGHEWTDRQTDKHIHKISYDNMIMETEIGAMHL